jgi:sugar lactone lactonase YvrE
MKPCAATFGGDGGPAMDARFSLPVGQSADPAGRIAFDADGNLFLADTGNNRIRRIAPDGTVTTVAGSGTAGTAGGPALMAELNQPVDVEVAPDGTLYIADTQNSCIRALGTDGNLRTVAGRCGERGFEGDGASPEQALLDRPYGIALNAAGDLYIADTHNNRIRIVPR